MCSEATEKHGRILEESSQEAQILETSIYSPGVRASFSDVIKRGGLRQAAHCKVAAIQMLPVFARQVQDSFCNLIDPGVQ